MSAAASIHAHTGTPTLQVSDACGLPVRTVQFHRRETGDPIDTRVTEQRFDAPGRLAGSRDPYLFDLARGDGSVPFNLSQIMSLSGAALMTCSVDAGWRIVLPGEAGQSVEHWDGRGSHSLTEYDELLRPVAVRESGHEVAEHTLERFTYGDAGAEFAARNLCGQRVRHDDPAGTVHVRALSINGNVLSHSRKFLTATDAPDWAVDDFVRDTLLEPGAGATTAYTFAPSSELLSQTDAFGNVQAFAYTVDGQLKNTRLTLAGNGQTEKLLVSNLHYTATGQIEAETAGNGAITHHHYDEATGRLTELSAHKADGTPLQTLKYCYDAVGNVLSIEDAAQPIRYFNNQRIEPIKTYRYDTLYQLIHATGCEAKTGSGGPALPDLQPLPSDPGQLANYTQTFYYDAGGNLLDLVHVGPQAHGRTLTRARYSNRCLPERDNRPPTEDELVAGFDANGNLRELQVGQSLTWDLRNQLHEVRPVVREDAEDDRERYIYDGGGQRVRKVHSGLTKARTVIREVRYLSGVEIRSHSGTGEILHVITVSAGSNSVQVLHWVAGQPQEIAQNQVRYSLGDHLKSSTLELDQNAGLISQEWYYPFGGTAYWAGRNATEAKYKTVRYSGKERDTTGLLYYGFRFYAPWLQRWLNPDPALNSDGLNIFSFVGGNPISFIDSQGLKRLDVNELTSDQKKSIGLGERTTAPAKKLKDYGALKKDPSFKLIEVDKNTFKTLTQVQTSNLVVKTIIFKGAANQRFDLWRTGEDLRSQIYNVRQGNTGVTQLSVPIIAQYGVGNCGEHAVINFNLLASTKTKEPVFLVKAKGVDHAFVVIGDKRQISEHKIVVADAWPTFPLPHTANIGAFEIGDTILAAPAGADSRYGVDSTLLDIEARLEFPKLSKQANNDVVLALDNNTTLYDQQFSRRAGTEGIDYKSKDGAIGKFNALPSNYVDNRIHGYLSYYQTL